MSVLFLVTIFITSILFNIYESRQFEVSTITNVLYEIDIQATRTYVTITITDDVWDAFTTYYALGIYIRILSVYHFVYRLLLVLYVNKVLEQQPWMEHTL